VKIDITSMLYFLKCIVIKMERKDLCEFSTMIAVLSMIVIFIIGFATESYLATPSSVSTGDDIV